MKAVPLDMMASAEVGLQRGESRFSPTLAGTFGATRQRNLVVAYKDRTGVVS